jgi:RecQ family ATP-dependent DNA helicase
MLWTDKANKYLKKYWNIPKLKDKQIEVINELLLGNDVIGLLPTGYGKSMCYIIPPLVTKKIMFIISPLISLMDEQKDKLLSLNIPCSALHGNNNNKDEEIQRIINNDIKIVYMSPEYLIKGDGMELAKLLINDDKLGFLAVDESHCISVWGQDFRPEYININKFRQSFPNIPIIAVTATATSTVCDDITKLL